MMKQLITALLLLCLPLTAQAASQNQCPAADAISKTKIPAGWQDAMGMQAHLHFPLHFSRAILVKNAEDPTIFCVYSDKSEQEIWLEQHTAPQKLIADARDWKKVNDTLLCDKQSDSSNCAWRLVG